MLIPWWSVLQGLQHQLRHQPIWWSNKLVWSTCIHHQLAPSPLLLAHRSITTPANHNPLLIVHPGCTNEYQRQEAARLATTYSGCTNMEVVLGPRRGSLRGHPATYLGKGAVDTLVTQCGQLDSRYKVFINTQLTGVQHRNLQRALQRPLMDRVELIISIFAQRARTKEAKLQVELARIQHLASMLVRTSTGSSTRGAFGDAMEVVSARERGRSGGASGGLGGGGGSGEKELRVQKQRLLVQRKYLLKQLAHVQATRSLQRAARQRRGVPVIALCGYTNAGKSSLLALLSKRPVRAADRLFETLDPTLRRVMLPSGLTVVVADTVGFVSDLPIELVEAFKATLEEVVSADVLLHVVDASARDAATQRHAVLQVLRQLGLSEHNLHTRVIEVWNKMDAVGNAMDAVGGHNAEEVVQVGDALQGGCTVEVVEKQGGAQQGGDRLHVVKPWLDNDGQHDRGEHEEDHTSHPWSTHDGLTRVAISVKTQLNIDQLLTAIDDKVAAVTRARQAAPG